MKKIKYIITLILFFSIYLVPLAQKTDNLFSFAKSRSNNLKIGIYITAQAVNNLLVTEAGMREAISLFQATGATKAYIEVYRSGLVIKKTILEQVRDRFIQNGIKVVGGIATVPGKNFGIKQDGKLGWFNWQNPKTQKDLKEVMKMAAGVFDEFIVDDFLCTADTSDESKIAKGDRSWSQYRRDLLTKLSSDIFIEPAKKVNPNIKMIIKYPQWYDRFHLFGYELEREPQLFDKVWVGTESRGQYTQRYGFVQPYEGFVNYRWIKDIAGEKIGGAWFDHGDCDENDFIEQAYQSVLAGAKEIVLFNYFDIVNGHKGHHLLRYQFEQLTNLAKSVSDNPVEGVVVYKPINSDAGGDLYIMDFLGMLGIPIVPIHQYPEHAKVIFFPTQAAKDKDILSKVERSLVNGTTIIFSAGFLANAENGERFSELAGVRYPVISSPVSTKNIISEGRILNLEKEIDLEANLILTNAEPILTAEANGKIPLLIKSKNNEANIITLNTHTFSQKDFDNIGEVLLCPKQLGLLDIPKSWANKIRQSFSADLDYRLDAPTRIVIQPLGSKGWVIHNYNKTSETITLTGGLINKAELKNGFTGEKITAYNNELSLTINPRSRIWIKTK